MRSLLSVSNKHRFRIRNTDLDAVGEDATVHVVPIGWITAPMNCKLNRIGLLLVSGILSSCLGCGSSSDVAERASTAPATTVRTEPQANPVDVVSQFLDRVRRGGEDASAGNLLTRKAQAELKRIGRSVQPIGSPDARFEVSRSQEVPGEPNSSLVHSVWSEPNGDGSMAAYQVVWAVERDPDQWRISGLAMELAPGEPPEIIDFEDGELMAQLLTASEKSAEQTPAQASAAETSVTR